jgi:hypothetical protein
MACGCDDQAVAGCLEIPELERLTYFYGQALGVKELQSEQRYFMTMLRLQARWLGGYGVVCGLEASLQPTGDPDCRESNDPAVRIELVLDPGIASDCHGRVLVVRRRMTVRLADLLVSKRLRERFVAREPLWVAICHAEAGTFPTRPVIVDPCETRDCAVYGRVRECYRIELRGEAVDSTGCDECCGACDEPCLALAVLRPEADAKDALRWVVDNGIRRPFGRRALTTVTGTSWLHGATYARADADTLLADGLRVRFSGPVLVDSLRRGVVEVLVWQGGGGLRDTVYRKPGEIVTIDEHDGRHGRVAREFRYSVHSDETLQYGDQVSFVLRSGFVLDDCCRAVDGEHIGGRVPVLDPDGATAQDEPWTSCLSRPDRPGAWTSGNGVEGGTFESWFFVESAQRYPAAGPRDGSR